MWGWRTQMSVWLRCVNISDESHEWNSLVQLSFIYIEQSRCYIKINKIKSKNVQIVIKKKSNLLQLATYSSVRFSCKLFTTQFNSDSVNEDEAVSLYKPAVCIIYIAEIHWSRTGLWTALWGLGGKNWADSCQVKLSKDSKYNFLHDLCWASLHSWMLV